MPVLKFLNSSEAIHALAEVHKGIADHHLGGCTIARKFLRAGYFWPTMKTEAMEYVNKCDKC